MMQEWIVHPNRSEIGSSAPGRNGHYRSVDQRAARLPAQRYTAKVGLPASLAGHGDPDGSITFNGSDWSFVTMAARHFVRAHGTREDVPPFGFSIKGHWQWWDGTTTDHSILETGDARVHVRRYLEALFPDAAGIELADLR